MQNASKAYKESMKAIGRNRGYIRVYIGVINSAAQKAVKVESQRNSFTYFSNLTKPFDGYPVDSLYATCEENFSKVDGSMRFLPREEKNVIYNNGIVTAGLVDAIYVSFGELQGLDIKGLTIDFGEYYPVEFSVEYDGGIRHYFGNDRAYWVTEDVFYGTSYFIIKPTQMVNGNGRLRIHQFICGIANTFSNKEVLNYSLKDYVSPISDTIPSQDMTLTVDNQNLYYSADNPDSALAFMEIGQEIKTAFGYDVDGKGNIEWIAENTTYLKSWTANDVQAKFTATDRFDNTTGTYYRGLYRENGISLYDMAIDVLLDAGITDEREYFVDPYLKGIVVNNPMPVVKHTEALQIIANAGRCVLYEDRQSRIRIQSSFRPDMSAEANNQAEYSHVENILVDDNKDAYALCSRDFSAVDGSVFFMPKDSAYLNTGYISESIADKEGQFRVQPKITIRLEAACVFHGLLIRFRNTAPQEFRILTYYQGIPVDEMTVENPDLEYVSHEQINLFDEMEVVFTKGYKNARVTVDNILLGDVTDYTLSYHRDLTNTPAGTRQEKVKSISVQRDIYKESAEGIKDLVQEEVVLSPDNNEYIAYFSNPSYGYTVRVEDNENVTCEIVEMSSFFVHLRFSGLVTEAVVKYAVAGYEYTVSTSYLVKQYNQNGKVVEWMNPLISTAEHAADLAEWLSSYYLGDIEYPIKWRGDPRVDANDLFYLELKERQRAMIRVFESTLKFSGAWSGEMKARKVVL